MKHFAFLIRGIALEEGHESLKGFFVTRIASSTSFEEAKSKVTISCIEEVKNKNLQMKLFPVGQEFKITIEEWKEINHPSEMNGELGITWYDESEN